MKLVSRSVLALGVLALAVVASGTLSGDSASATPESVLKAIDVTPVPAASNWSFEGCAKLRPWTDCRDVYRDGSGARWICSNCGKTRNPSSGKCSPLTSEPAEWCS